MKTKTAANTAMSGTRSLHIGKLVLEVEVSIPLSVLKEFDAYCTYYDRSMPGWAERWPQELRARLLRSIYIGSQNTGPINRPRCGVGSAKGRLKVLQKKLRSEACQTVIVPMPVETWTRIHDREEETGFTVEGLCLAYIDYHAALWRAKVAKQQSDNPAGRFEKALSKDLKKRPKVSAAAR